MIKITIVKEVKKSDGLWRFMWCTITLMYFYYIFYYLFYYVVYYCYYVCNNVTQILNHILTTNGCWTRILWHHSLPTNLEINFTNGFQLFLANTSIFRLTVMPVLREGWIAITGQQQRHQTGKLAKNGEAFTVNNT